MEYLWWRLWPPVTTSPLLPEKMADEDVVDPSASPTGRHDQEAPAPVTELFGLDPSDASDDQITDIINRHVKYVLSGKPVAARYNVVLLFDNSSIGRSDSDRIYRALAGMPERRPILLVMNSPGGDVAAAYLIAKLCREYALETFEVVVPRRAKSAATLIACGADAIHMGSLSELGPIDPQFNGIPALAYKHSVEHLAALTSEYPAAAEMFARYLSNALRIEWLGYYERVAASATHYAKRLLDNRSTSGSGASEAIAQRLVYEYKDHGFVIDSREATTIFGDEIVKQNTDEYRLGNALYVELDLIEWVVRRFGRQFLYTGLPGAGAFVYRPSAN